MSASKLAPAILRELENCGLPYEVEVTKGKAKLRLAGRLAGLVGVSKREPTGHVTRNVCAQIRRVAAGASA